MSNTPKEIGLRIRIARKERNFSQEDLAKLVDLSRASIVNIEKGRQSPPIQTLLLLCRKLNKQLAFFVRLDIKDEVYPDYVLSRKLHDELDSIPIGDIRMFLSFRKRLVTQIKDADVENKEAT